MGGQSIACNLTTTLVNRLLGSSTGCTGALGKVRDRLLAGSVAMPAAGVADGGRCRMTGTRLLDEIRPQ